MTPECESIVAASLMYCCINSYFVVTAGLGIGHWQDSMPSKEERGGGGLIIATNRLYIILYKVCQVILAYF